MGRPELASDPRFATHTARKANEDALDGFVSDWTREHDRWELAGSLQQAGVAAAPVENLRDTFERDPQLRHHYQLVRQPSSPEVDIPIDREAIRFVGHDHTIERAPMLGEHNEFVARDLLGMTEEEYARLIVDDVLR
jgi:crotonobetainyl-CoA:carnitine CoA-transferase CaiB-like acyl-CoA transferase